MFHCLKWPFTHTALPETTKMLKITPSFTECTKMIKQHNNRNTQFVDYNEIVIVGGGVCALWFAIHFRKFNPLTKIVILEKRNYVTDTHYVSVDSSIFKTYVEFENVLGNSFTLGTLYEQLIEYIECNCEDIFIINNMDESFLTEVTHKAVFVMDGASRSFSGKVFSEHVSENLEYFVELQYTTKHESITLPESAKTEIYNYFHNNINVQEIVCGTRVVLRVELPYSSYAKINNKTFFEIPDTQRRVLNYWLHARKTLTRETVLGVVSVRYFSFPIFTRTRFAMLRQVPYFVMGAAAFQLSISDGLSACMDLAASVAPIFAKDIGTVIGEYNFFCESFLRKVGERGGKKECGGGNYILNATGDWESDFFD